MSNLWNTFEADREMLDKQYVKAWNNEESFERVENLKNRVMELADTLKGESHPVIKAKCFDYILENAPIYINPDDWFGISLEAVKMDPILDIGCHYVKILNSLSDKWKNELERVCNAIKKMFPYAKVIFATSTPVQEELFWRNYRYNKDIEEYNNAAIEIAKKHGFEINDLYALMKDAPKSYHSDVTHYYTKEGTKLITNKVVRCIENCLNIKAKELDYDKLFTKTDDVVGI